MIVTAYLIYQHYKDPGGAFCNVNDYVSCDIVNKSIYSEIFGIPVAALGFVSYGVLFILSIRLSRGEAKQLMRQQGASLTRRLVDFATLFSGAGLLFSLYLTYIEFFVLQALCILCITQQILILFIFLIYLYIWFAQRKSLRLA